MLLEADYTAIPGWYNPAEWKEWERAFEAALAFHELRLADYDKLFEMNLDMYRFYAGEAADNWIKGKRAEWKCPPGTTQQFQDG